MSFRTISAILRGNWLIDKSWADAHLPVVFKMMAGEKVNFGNNPSFIDDDANEESPEIIFKRKAVLLANTASVYKVSPYTNLDTLPNNSITMLTIAGPILKYGDMCSYGSVDYANLINRLTASQKVSGIILNIDSPGGQADGTAMLADVIKSADAIKPVIAMIDDGMAASAAMWIASGAREIYVTQPTSQVGSIGVYTTIADWSSHYKDYYKLPITDVYAPQSIDKNKIYHDAISGDITGLEGSLSVVAEQFINTVATNRTGKIKGETWNTGKMFYAKEATSIGLIDGQKTFDQIVKRMEKLIKNSTNNNNSNTMAFNKTLIAAKAESFSVTDEGFLLSEDQLNNIESALVDTEALEQANATITDLTEQNNALQASVEDANNSIVEANATIADLKNKIEKLNGKASGNGTTLVHKVENTGVEIKTKISINDASHPLNVAAAAIIEAKSKK